MGNLTTDNLGATKPVATNQLSTDVERVRAAFDTFDAAIQAHQTNTSNPHNTTAAQVGAIPDAAGSVNDTRLGSRTADVNSVPGASVGTLTQWVSWTANRFKAITGAINWYDAPATTLVAAKSHIDATGNPHGTTAAQVGAIPANNGAVTDALVGNRTVDQGLANPANTGTLTQLASWLAGRIRAITGASNWTDAPVTTLTVAASHFANTSNPHATTAAQVGAPTTTGVGALGTWGISISGNAASATTAASCSGNSATATTAASCSGNSATATRLQTARTINGTSFDGSQNIVVPMLKSLQKGTSSGTGNRTATLTTAVDPAKSIVLVSCASGKSLVISGAFGDTAISVTDGAYLLNGTTLQIVAGYRESGNQSATIYWQVLEYY